MIFNFELIIFFLYVYYYQKVSNTIWSNEGYLVTLDISDDTELFIELRKLNNDLGIIKLNPEDGEQSEIILLTRENKNIN